MKLADVEVGRKYLVKVSGTLAVVKIQQRVEPRGGRGFTKQTRFLGVNEATGRQVGPFTAARCRAKATVQDEMFGRINRAGEGEGGAR